MKPHSTFFLILTSVFLSALLPSCDSTYDINAGHAREWSQKTTVTERKTPAIFSTTRADERSIILSTAALKESAHGVMYDGGEILQTGYLVYPGAQPAANIEEAITIARKTKGFGPQ